MYLQGFWPKSVYLKCFGNQLKTMYLQGPCSSRPCISRPCCICKHRLIFRTVFYTRPYERFRELLFNKSPTVLTNIFLPLFLLGFQCDFIIRIVQSNFFLGTFYMKNFRKTKISPIISVCNSILFTGFFPNTYSKM